MRKLFPIAFILFSFFIFSQTNAQIKTFVITSEDIGTLKCSYLKKEQSNINTEFSIQIIYKNQQFVYKQEQDTIHLKSKAQIIQFVNDLRLGLNVINDEEKDLNIQNNLYTIVKNKGYSDNNFIVFVNKNFTIKTPVNKFFVNQLINWLNTIDFGKG